MFTYFAESIERRLRQQSSLHWIRTVIYIKIICSGVWPSGKAPAFGAGIRGFESLHPSHSLNIVSVIFKLWLSCKVMRTKPRSDVGSQEARIDELVRKTRSDGIAAKLRHPSAPAKLRTAFGWFLIWLELYVSNHKVTK